MATELQTGSTVRRIMLGAQLRSLREAAGITREDAGYTIRSSGSKISRMELGRFGFKERDVLDLLTLYGVTDEQERAALLALAREANTPGWWHQYGDVLPSWFQVYVGLEGAATLIRTYEVQFVPGLLQTPDYTRAVARRAQPTMPVEELERRVSVRMTRQRALSRPEPARLWAIVDEAVLRRSLGGREVMRTQLEHLIGCCKHPNITLQVMRFGGGYAAEGGAFSILRFAEADLPDVVYIEQLTGALYLDKRADVDQHLDAMDRLSVDSEPPESTPEILDQILRET
ncbi:MAG: helix-turn-helix domain-containing protein [Sporichthyaceae bacterium]|nr:helix-turn-helix domain-containing protein [Sporichthyaceae bacterium]